MKTIIVWYRNDLRVHDHPAFSQAVANADAVVPVYIFDTSQRTDKHSSSNRNRFLLESLQDLTSSLEKKGGNLVVREGDPQTVLLDLAAETHAHAVYFTADYTPYSTKRDKEVHDELVKNDIEVKQFGGRLIVSKLDEIRTKAGTVHKVFTPFWKSWMQVQRRELSFEPRTITLPSQIKIGKLPSLDTLTTKRELSPKVLKGGETAAKKRLNAFLSSDIEHYHEDNNTMSLEATSKLSPYLHFGCISSLYAESLLDHKKGSQSWRRQLAWRDFYHYVLYYNPDNSQKEYQEKYRNLKWDDDEDLLKAWQEGKTGYPAVDAAMRQLNQEGWMHNRARLIVGSFLTKDLWLDWRHGETYFMKMLLDGDQANNNGNWQWIASVGVDPAPVYRRLYNPSSQRDKFDPSGDYVRKYVPELKDVPDKYLSEPWTMIPEMQDKAQCIIGKDYPEPIVNHKEARLRALENYRV